MTDSNKSNEQPLEVQVKHNWQLMDPSLQEELIKDEKQAIMTLEFEFEMVDGVIKNENEVVAHWGNRVYRCKECGIVVICNDDNPDDIKPTTITITKTPEEVKNSGSSTDDCVETWVSDHVEMLMCGEYIAKKVHEI